MKNIVIFGGGLHANVCIDVFEKGGEYKIIGIIDSKADIGDILLGYPVIGCQEKIVDVIETHNIDAGFIAIGDNFDRELVRDVVVSQLPDFVFVNAIHPSVIIGRNVTLGTGIAMMAGVIVNPGAEIEDFCILNTGAQLEHDCYMGQFSNLSCGSVTGGGVRIGEFSNITPGVTIIDRINIGKNTVVGSGAVVVKDLPDNVVAYGSPSKTIRSRKPGEKFLK